MSGTIDPALLTRGQGSADLVPLRDAARYPAQYSADGAFQGHEISVQIRLPGDYGGSNDGEVILATTLHDTGATIGSIYRSDWTRLNINQIPAQGSIPTTLADGRVEIRDTVTFEIRFVSWAADGAMFAISDFIAETAVIVEDPLPGAAHPHPRLSGDAGSRALFFLTTPREGYDFLYVARTKEAMIQILQSL